MPPKASKKRTISQARARISPPTLLPSPPASQIESLPLASDSFRQLAAVYNGVAVEDNGEPYEGRSEQGRRDSGRLTTEDELAFVKHTPSGSERRLRPGESLADKDIERQLADFDKALDRENLAHNKQRWRELYRTVGYRGVARQLMDDEISTLYSGKATINDRDLHWTTAAMTDVLESTYPRLLQSVMLGNLAYDRRHDTVLEAILEKLWAQAKYQPGIYCQQVVDDDALSPTPAQYQQVAQMMLQYAKGCDHPKARAIDEEPLAAEVVNKIDNYMAGRNQISMADTARSPHAYRHYLWKDDYVERQLKAGEFAVSRPPTRTGRAAQQEPATSEAEDVEEQPAPRRKTAPKKPKTRVQRLVPDRISVLVAFVESLRRRLEQIPEELHDDPMEIPLVEIGYAAHCIDRLKAHATHRNSNFLMNLVDSILAVLADDASELRFDRRFHIDQAVIYLIYSPEQAEIAEIGWTKLAEGYTANGGGFSHYPAGLSNASALKTSVLVWSSAMAYAVNDSALRLNHQVNLNRLRARSEAVKARDRTERDLYVESRGIKAKAIKSVQASDKTMTTWRDTEQHQELKARFESLLLFTRREKEETMLSEVMRHTERYQEFSSILRPLGDVLDTIEMARKQAAAEAEAEAEADSSEWEDDDGESDE